MKTQSRGNFTFYCLIGLTFIILVSGCKDKSAPKFLPSSAPKEQQIEKSKFAQFISNIKSLPIDERLNRLNKFLEKYLHSPIVEDNGIATFYWLGNASSVLIYSDILNGLTQPDTMNCILCGDMKLFYKFYSLPADARIDYHFVIDEDSKLRCRNVFTF